MTARITITNHATVRTVRIAIRDRTPGGETPPSDPNVAWTMTETHDVESGETLEVWIHANRDFVVTELP